MIVRKRGINNIKGAMTMNFIKYIQSADGTNLYGKINTVNNSKANVIIVHGLAEYLDRYDELAAFLNNNQFNVIRYDQRGHGRSEGKPVYYNNENEIIEDLDATVQCVMENCPGNIYLIGHSMGGYAVTLYGTKHPGLVDGIITSGALTRNHLNLFGDLDSNHPYDMYIPNELGEGLCSDEEVVQIYETDDLIAEDISMGLIYTLLDGVKILKENAAYFTEPILILHGKDDGLVSYQDSLELYNEIGSKHKSIHIYDGLQHEIFNESSYNKNIFREIVEWLTREINK